MNAQDKGLHWSDCAIYNEPAYPAGECNCGGAKAGSVWWRKLYRRVHIRFLHWKMLFEAWIG